MKKVLLITPPYHCGVVESAGTWLPLPFVYVGGSLKKAGYEVEIYDAMSKFHSYDQIGQRIEESKPHVVASTAFTATLMDALEVLRLAKKINPQTITLLGGVHPTFCWQEVLEENPFVDYIIRGEGEITTPLLLNQIFAKKDPAKILGVSFLRERRPFATPNRPFIPVIDFLPTAWELIEWSDYTYRPHPGSTLAVVSFSRGCVQKCSFCSQQRFWEQTWRCRSPENFGAELEYLHKNYGVNVAMISDEAPAVSRKHWEKLLDILIAKKLDLELLLETRVVDILRDEDILHKYREAGIVHIYTGVESGSQETLDQFKKHIKVEESRRAIELINEAGIISETSFVLGMPDETRKSIKETTELAKHYNPDLAFFLTIAPWPYSDIYDELKPYIEVFDYRKYNLVEPVVKPKEMSREELSKELFKAFRNFYLNKMAQIPKMPQFKRDYMVSVGKLLANHSYLAKEMKGLQMPLKIHQYLTDLLAEKSTA